MVNKNEIAARIKTGQLISCTAEEYPTVRSALHDLAGKWIDSRQDIYATIALLEVQRLQQVYESEEE